MAGFQQSINQLLTTGGLALGIYGKTEGSKLKKFDEGILQPTYTETKKALGAENMLMR